MNAYTGWSKVLRKRVDLAQRVTNHVTIPKSFQMINQIKQNKQLMNVLSLKQRKFNEMITKANEFLLETEEDVRVFKEAMVEMGYPPHDSIDIKKLRYIAEIYRNEGVEYTSDLMHEFMEMYYDEQKIKQFAHSWEHYGYLTKRLPILRNVVMAHNLGMYNVSVPSIISQYEGMIIERFGVTGRTDGAVLSKLLKYLLSRPGSFDDSIKEYYNKFVLSSFGHGEKMESDIGRNAILHGADTEYGNKIISIKSILLFDYLAETLNDLDHDIIDEGRQEAEDHQVKKGWKKRKDTLVGSNL